MTSAVVRDAEPHELDTVALLLSRALINSPALLWMGSVPKAISLPPGESINPKSLKALPKQLEIIYNLHRSILGTTRLSTGRVLVAVRPENGKDKIVGVTIWIPPGSKEDGFMTFLRSKSFRVLTGTLRRPGGWGLTGYRRLILTYESRLKTMRNNIFEIKGIDRKSAWNLISVATDPEEEGKGYCGKVIRYGFSEITKDSPVFVETSLARNRDVYQHLGFEVIGSTTFGEKEVNSDGLPPPKGERKTATGFLVYILLKSNSVETT